MYHYRGTVCYLGYSAGEVHQGSRGWAKKYRDKLGIL